MSTGRYEAGPEEETAEGVGDPRAEAEGELSLARIALDDGDPRHAATHLAGAITADPSLPGVYQGLHDLDVAAGGALGLFDVEGDIFIGTAAARSYLAARAGHVDEAFELLCMVAGHEPDRPWTASGWLDSTDLGTVLDVTRAVAALLRMALQLPDPVDPPIARNLSPFLDVARSLVANRPEARPHLARLSTLARRMGAAGEAVAWCEIVERESPDPSSAIMLAYALRSAGRLPEMERAWLTALDRDPANLEVHTDFAESLWSQGRLPEALHWLEKALTLDPGHAKAFPSASALRFQLDGDVRHLVALVDHWRAHPDHDYAEQMLSLACDDKTWLNVVPAPSEAIINMILQLAEQTPDPQERRAVSGTGTLSALEPPSALATVHRVTPGLAVDVQDVPEPDLRTPLVDGRYKLWRYEGTNALPLVAPPSATAAEALRQVAGFPWANPVDAYDRAIALSSLSLDDLLGLLVHVPAAPELDHWQRMEQTNPVYWPRFAQAWACLGILHHRADEPWPTSARRAVLLDLATGVEDWTTDSALNAMVVAAWVDPSIRPDVYNLVGHRFMDALKTYQKREVTIMSSLAQLVLATPDMLPDVTALAQQILADASDDEDPGTDEG
jgi:tetratricopeptide (TPR) repeat protein